MRRIIFILLSILLFVSCDSSNMNETSDDQFIGTWKLTDRSMLDGIEIEIKKDENGTFNGTVTKLNENKYVLIFMEEGDKLLTGIKRNSNFQFEISEKKIAAPLFSQYDQGTSMSFSAEFDGKDKILLGKNGSDGSYVRVK